jgi:catechol 2,3-dioxygenase-like lactoylglutathione lyase family enzyme
MKLLFKQVIIFGQNINMLKEFYVDHFGLELLEEIKNEWVVLKAGQTEIAFHKIGAAYQTSEDVPFKADSNTKFVFEIEGDLKNFRRKLLEKGVLLRDVKSFAGMNYLFCDGEDAEGNVFQLKQKIL